MNDFNTTQAATNISGISGSGSLGSNKIPRSRIEDFPALNSVIYESGSLGSNKIPRSRIEDFPALKINPDKSMKFDLNLMCKQALSRLTYAVNANSEDQIKQLKKKYAESSFSQNISNRNRF